MGLWLKQSTAVTLLFGPFLDEDDGKTAEGGLTITQAEVRLSKNGGNMAQKNEATALVHDELGFYTCLLDATDTNTLGILAVAVHESGALPVWQYFMVVPANEYDSLILGTDALDVEVASMAAGVVTAAAVDTGAIDADAIAANAIGASEIATGAIDADAIAADAITAAKIATDAIDADAIAANAIGASELAAGAITSAELAVSALNAIADQLLERDIDQVEGAAATHSLVGAVLALVSRIRDDGAGNVIVYETDGVTPFITRVITVDAALDPIESFAVGT